MLISIFGKDININKGFLILGAIVIALVVGTVGYYININNNKVVIEKNNNESYEADNKALETSTQAAVEVQKQNKDKKSEDEIKIYVTGSVNLPGIVTLKKEQLIDDAINAAGGANKDADLNNVNLVYKLKENLMLYIKSKEESKLTVKAGEAGKGIEVIRDSAGTVVNENATVVNSKAKVNINSATIDELDTLPGVGKETAKDIVAYREKNGGFKAISDIMKVSGIKENKYNKIKEYVSVD